MRLVDTHCHLHSKKFDSDRDEVRARALETLEWIVAIGGTLEECRQAIALTGDRVYAVAGIHPYYAKDFDDKTLAAVRGMTERERVVAVGEIGLDYFNEFSPRDDQHRVFEAQLELACEVELPVVIHNREADADTYDRLRRYADRLRGCVMHCFGSDAAFAKRCLDLGFYISFAGNVTFPKAEPLREAAKVVPMDKLLVETDAPYLAPIPLRGKRCEPAFVKHTGEFLAELKGVSFDAFADRTTANAAAFYQLDEYAAARG